MVTTVESLKTFATSLDGEVEDWEKWIEKKKITLKTEDEKTQAELENKVQKYEDQLSLLEKEV